jgi:RNA polymerase sigma factor (sigma-70 family)
LALLAGRCRDVHEAEDITHEALLRAARFRGRQTDPTRLVAWLVRIAANVHRDHVRREARVWYVAFDDPALEVSAAREQGRPWGDEGHFVIADREVPHSEVAGALALSWDDLCERDRVVLAAFYGEDGSAVAAASACAVPRENVKVRLHRARRRLEERIRVHLAAAAIRRLTNAGGMVSRQGGVGC